MVPLLSVYQEGLGDWASFEADEADDTVNGRQPTSKPDPEESGGSGDEKIPVDEAVNRPMAIHGAAPAGGDGDEDRDEDGPGHGSAAGPDVGFVAGSVGADPGDETPVEGSGAARSVPDNDEAAADPEGLGSSLEASRGGPRSDDVSEDAADDAADDATHEADDKNREVMGDVRDRAAGAEAGREEGQGPEAGLLHRSTGWDRAFASVARATAAPGAPSPSEGGTRNAAGYRASVSLGNRDHRAKGMEESSRSGRGNARPLMLAGELAPGWARRAARAGDGALENLLGSTAGFVVPVGGIAVVGGVLAVRRRFFA